MGCDKSKCWKDTPSEVEVEIGGESAPLTNHQFSSKKVPPLKLQQDDITNISLKGRESSQNRNSKVACSAEYESTKLTKWEYTQSAFNSTTFRHSTQPLCLSSNVQEVLISTGKARDQLNSEYLAAEKSIKAIIRKVIASTTVLEDINTKLYHWQNSVYNYNMTEFTLSHEIYAWSDLALLMSFCEKNKLSYDSNFFKLCERKLTQLASLSMIITFEINLTDEVVIEQNSSKISANYFVSARVAKPFNPANIPGLLEGNVEQDNLVTWYDSNQLMCSDFGFTANLREKAREMQLGCFIFGESGRTNLSNVLSAFQSYGADFTQEQIRVMKRLPAEELKVLFLINENGVSGVRAILRGIKDHILPEFLKVFEQKYCDNEKVKSALELLEQEDLIEDKNAFTHFLEFSVDGFKAGCEVRMGKEHGSFVYLDMV